MNDQPMKSETCAGHLTNKEVQIVEYTSSKITTKI